MNTRLFASLFSLLLVLCADGIAQERAAVRQPVRAQVANPDLLNPDLLNPDIADAPVARVQVEPRGAGGGAGAAGVGGVAAQPSAFSKLRLSARSSHQPGRAFVSADNVYDFDTERDRIMFGHVDESAVRFRVHLTQPGRYLFECAVRSAPQHPKTYKVQVGQTGNWTEVTEVSFPADRPEPEGTIVVILESDNAGWGTVRLLATRGLPAILDYCEITSLP